MTQNPVSASGGKPEGKVFLRACPICEEGPVHDAGSTDDAKLFACRTCESVLAETIFGFQYQQIDPRFEKRKDEYEGQTFTRAQIQKAAEDIYRARVAVKPAAKPNRLAQKPDDKGEPELFWQVDKDEVERRKKSGEAAQAANKPLTVDDMLEELKNQSGG